MLELKLIGILMLLSQKVVVLEPLGQVGRVELGLWDIMVVREVRRVTQAVAVLVAQMVSAVQEELEGKIPQAVLVGEAMVVVRLVQHPLGLQVVKMEEIIVVELVTELVQL